MAKNLNKKVKEYFKRDNAASVWWNVDNLPRYNKQTQWMSENIYEPSLKSGQTTLSNKI